MKQHLKPLKTITAAVICSLLLSQTVQAEGTPFSNFKSSEEPKEKKPLKKIRNKTTTFASRNNDAVKIYPDIIKREMHVVAKENEGKEISFFVFDLQGTLMQQYKMKAKDHYRVSGLKKGVYIYRVFNGDEETATGKFEIR